MKISIIQKEIFFWYAYFVCGFLVGTFLPDIAIIGFSVIFILVFITQREGKQNEITQA